MEMAVSLDSVRGMAGQFRENRTSLLDTIGGLRKNPMPDKFSIAVRWRACIITL